MLAIRLDKDRTFDVSEEEWDSFASKLNFKRYIEFHAATHGDTTYIDTSSNCWSIRYAGTSHVFDFELIGNESVKKITKWLSFKFLSSYSVDFARRCFGLFIRNSWQLADLVLPSLYKKMELCRTNSEQYTYKDFSILKSVANLLISYEAPKTDIEDLFDLEQQLLGRSKAIGSYYDTDLRLCPLEEQFISVNAKHDIEYIERLNYAELRDFVVLKLCYEIGLRPYQLFSLSQDDFRVINNSYYSIKRPLAKKGKINQDKKGLDQLQISPELGNAVQTLISLQKSSSKQLLQWENGDEFTRMYSISSINNTLSRWGSETPHKTPYDFRHSMAHRLVMAGCSASEIAFMLGHEGLETARHYIAASPSVSTLREKALGKNATYGALIALLTGDIKLSEDWNGENVLGVIGNELTTGIGGCDAESCEYVPVYNCYGCNDFHPFEDGNHDNVLKALRGQVIDFISISQNSGQEKINPAMTQLEGVIEQVKAVISRCTNCKRSCNEG